MPLIRLLDMYADIRPELTKCLSVMDYVYGKVTWVYCRSLHLHTELTTCCLREANIIHLYLKNDGWLAAEESQDFTVVWQRVVWLTSLEIELAIVPKVTGDSLMHLWYVARFSSFIGESDRPFVPPAPFQKLWSDLAGLIPAAESASLKQFTKVLQTRDVAD